MCSCTRSRSSCVPPPYRLCCTEIRRERPEAVTDGATDLSAERSLAHAQHHPHTVAMGNSACKDGTVRRRGSTPTMWPVSFVEAEARLGIRIAEGSIHAQRTGLLVEMQEVHSFLGRLARSHYKTSRYGVPAGPVWKVVVAQF